MSISRGAAGAVNVGKPIEDPPRKNTENYEKRKLLEEQGPLLWDRLRAQMTKLCSALNAEYGKEVVTTQMESAGEMDARLSVAGAVSKLSVTFDAVSPSCALKWFYSGPATRTSPDRRCRIYVHNGTVGFQANATPYTPEVFAKQMFEGLLSE